MTHRAMALALGISEPTFRAAYALELETAVERKRAEALTLLHKAAKGGNVSAIRQWNERLDEAELRRLGGAHPQPDKRPAEDTPGKKAAALTAAHDVMSGEGKWARLLKLN